MGPVGLCWGIMEEQPNTAADATPVAVQPAAPRTEGTRTISRDHLFEIVAAIMLGVASVAAAWSGYQAALWGGVQSADYVRASGYRVESTKASTASGQDRLFDSQVFSRISLAADRGDVAVLRHGGARPPRAIRVGARPRHRPTSVSPALASP